MTVKKIGILTVGAGLLLLISVCVCRTLASGGIVRVARVAMAEAKGTHQYVSSATFPNADLVAGVWNAGDGYDLESYDHGLQWVALKHSVRFRNRADGTRLITGQRYEVVGPLPQHLQYILQTLPKPTQATIIDDKHREVAMWERVVYVSTVTLLVLVCSLGGIALSLRRWNWRTSSSRKFSS